MCRIKITLKQSTDHLGGYFHIISVDLLSCSWKPMHTPPLPTNIRAFLLNIAQLAKLEYSLTLHCDQLEHLEFNNGQ